MTTKIQNEVIQLGYLASDPASPPANHFYLYFKSDGLYIKNSTGTITGPMSSGGGSTVGLLEFKGSTDCSANPNYPSAEKGDVYLVSVAGKIGGASGKSVDAGDMYVATADNAGGAEGSVGTNWIVLEHNLVGALISSNNLSDVANAATARTNLGLAIGTNVQAYDADLNAIAALSPSNDDVLQLKSGAWTNRTLSQLSTDMTELIQDIIGAMVSGNVETGITVTYDDTNGKIDFVVSGGGSAKGRAEFLVATVPLASGAPIAGLDGASTPAEGIPYYEFANGSVTYREFYCRLLDYSGGGLTLNFEVLRTSAASAATYIFDAAIRRINTGTEDLDASHTYDYNSVTVTIPAGPPNAGIPMAGTITFTDGADMDSLATGDLFILRFRRNGGTATDTARVLAGITLKET